MHLFSDGKVVDEVLKQRLQNKVYTWFREINAMVAIKPGVIFDKDSTASPVQCTCIIYNIVI